MVVSYEFCTDASLHAWAAGVFRGAQLYLSKKQITADHERSRRERSVDILIEWSKNLKKEGSLARKIIECLSEDQCRDIFNQREVKVAKKHQILLDQLFPSTIEQVDGDVIQLTEAQSTELRWHAITYLNALEFTLVAWQYSVVDREIIEVQFSYLFSPADGHEVLKHFRKAAGGEDSFPAIELFTAHLIDKRKNQLIKKLNVA
ncbi:hypothetical protein [Chitinilyticum litopenaei]|uniref:hypothetical protein n=1 Tax=Chitinilyticum litopenaei TaxID=1121276 RepID=UPI00118703C4|nr:hypothetical protein [Chitinilyticum litopenaei]